MEHGLRPVRWVGFHMSLVIFLLRHLQARVPSDAICTLVTWTVSTKFLIMTTTSANADDGDDDDDDDDNASNRPINCLHPAVVEANNLAIHTDETRCYVTYTTADDKQIDRRRRSRRRNLFAVINLYNIQYKYKNTRRATREAKAHQMLAAQHTHTHTHNNNNNK